MIEIILMQRVEKLGQMGEVVSVKPGGNSDTDKRGRRVSLRLTT